MSERIIELKNVTMEYTLYHHLTGGLKNFILNFPSSLREFKKHRFTVLNDISFSVKKGESVAIIGRNGAGKSTVLGLIAGVLKPQKGSIITKGRISPFLELGAGFHFDLTGRENIILNGVLMGLYKKDVMDKLDEIVEFSELGEFIDQPIRIYSSGMLTRLGFSVAAHLEPEILLIDEVFGVGDAAFIEKCAHKIEEFRSNGVTMVVVSHNPEDVKKYCDRVVWIENHTIKGIGEPDEMLNLYANHT